MKISDMSSLLQSLRLSGLPKENISTPSIAPECLESNRLSKGVVRIENWIKLCYYKKCRNGEWGSHHLWGDLKTLLSERPAGS